MQRLLLNTIYSFIDLQLLLKSNVTGKLTQPYATLLQNRFKISFKFRICDHQRGGRGRVTKANNITFQAVWESSLFCGMLYSVRAGWRTDSVSGWNRKVTSF